MVGHLQSVERVYLDHNATTPMRPEAIAAMQQWLGRAANPSSVHQSGREAKAAIEKARQTLATALHAPSAGIIFTGGGSEACNQAILGWAPDTRPFTHLYVSAIEHDAVRQAAAYSDCTVHNVPVDQHGQIDCAALADLLAQHGSGLVCAMLANNETGVIQPIAEIVEIARAHQALVFCDATQAVGKIPVSFLGLGVDALAISAHKFGGPAGVGALIMRPTLPVAARIHGGGQELRRRAGTENVAGISAMAAALAVACSAENHGIADARNAFEQALKQEFEAVRIFGDQAERLPNSCCFAVPGVKAETLIMALDLAGVAVSSGSACSSGKVAPSHVLQAMGVAPELAQAAIRVSLGWDNHVEPDLARCIDVLVTEINRQLPVEMRKKSA